MAETYIEGPLFQKGHESQIYSDKDDLDALDAFDKMFPEFANDQSLGFADAVSNVHPLLQADESPSASQAQIDLTNEEHQDVLEQNDSVEDERVKALFQNIIDGIESSIFGNQQVESSGAVQMNLPSQKIAPAVKVNQPRNTIANGQQDLQPDFDDFDLKDWKNYQDNALTDEEAKKKNWDALISWVDQSWKKARAEAEATRADKACRKRPRLEETEDIHVSNTTPQASKRRRVLPKDPEKQPSSQPQQYGPYRAAPSPYQSPYASRDPPASSRGSNQLRTNRNRPSNPDIRLEHDERLNHPQRELGDSRYMSPYQPRGPAQSVNGAPGYQINTLGPGGLNEHKVPRQLLGKRGRRDAEEVEGVNTRRTTEAGETRRPMPVGNNNTPEFGLSAHRVLTQTERDLELLPSNQQPRSHAQAPENQNSGLDPGIYKNQDSEDGTRAKRRRNNANPGTESRPQRHQNANPPEPQYYGVGGAPMPLALPDGPLGATQPTPFFIGDSRGPKIPGEAIHSIRDVNVPNERSYTSNQHTSVVGQGMAPTSDHVNLAGSRRTAGPSMSAAQPHYSEDLHRALWGNLRPKALR